MTSCLKPLKIFVGFDQKESIAYHVFCQSLISRSTRPLAITPLALGNIGGVYTEKHIDGSNSFIYSRFLVPYLSEFKGLAIFFDGDMVIRKDVSILLESIDVDCAVNVVQHDYETKFNTKYFGNPNESYPRKNWSSVIVWNCEHESNKILTPEYVGDNTGAHLHRFKWLRDDQIGALDVSWNWLDQEYPLNKNPNLVHYTIGTPCFTESRRTDHSYFWDRELYNSMEGIEASLAEEIAQHFNAPKNKAT